MQQRPTCTNVRIRSTRDAHKIFYAVQRRVLPMITRRLDADERLALRSGCVYSWEERGPHTEITGLGIERFTEGRRWSPSRVRDVRSHFVSIDTRARSFLAFSGVPFLLRKVHATRRRKSLGVTTIRMNVLLLPHTISDLAILISSLREIGIL